MAKSLNSKNNVAAHYANNVADSKMLLATDIEFVGGMSEKDAVQKFLSAKSDPNWSKQLGQLRDPKDVALLVSTHENGSLDIMAAQRDASGRLSVYPNLTENMIMDTTNVVDTAYVGGDAVRKKLELIQNAGIGVPGNVISSIDGVHTEVKFDMDALRSFDAAGVAHHEATAVERAERITQRGHENIMYSPQGFDDVTDDLKNGKLGRRFERALPSMADDLFDQMQRNDASFGDFGDE